MKSVLLVAFFCAFLLVSPAKGQDTTAGKVYWYGSVDSKVHLTIRGDRLEQKAVEGNDTAPGRYSFTAALPESAATVGVNRLEGRSNKVKVIQQPSASNDFTAIIEIHDDAGGARDYLLEIFWQ